MVISKLHDETCAEESTASALLMDRGNSFFVDGCVDFKGEPAHRSSSGGWRSAWFIIAVEMTERFAFYGIASNLIMYLTGPLGQSTAVAAENVNIWSGTATLLPLLGGFIADSFLGRYRTIIVASLIYILGLGLLTLSAVLTSADISGCLSTKFATSCDPPWFLVILFFISLYLVALGVGGHKPCAQTFGADQFDGQDPTESKARNSFFNWWYFGLAMGAFITSIVTVYIQENFSWALGFGIPFIVMLAQLLIFLIGSSTYRYSSKTDEKNPFKKIGQVFVKATKNWKTIPSSNGSDEGSYEFHQGSGEFRFLNKALLAPDGSMEEETISAKDVEETKALLRLTPIWFTSLTYAIVFAQTSTFFTKQGATMDRTVFGGIKVPAASLQSVSGLTIIVFVPIYDFIFVPVARALTGKPSGITMLQRIAAGMVFSALSMVAAALVEMKRLETAEKYGLVDMPNVTVPMSIWWLVPQYMLCGIADVFTIVGLQEFFYDQMPKELRSVGLALYHSVMGVGSFLSSFLVSIIDEATTSGNEGESWFADNLNRAHIDYFYWLLAGLSALGFIAYFSFARAYIYTTSNNLRRSA